MVQVTAFDVFVIGGGINGASIARDAVGRGYRVALAEMGDLAGATSSKATKLIHGGLRYLEYYEFRLVREALMEREILWANAPHIIHPLRFILPFHNGGQRPAWMLRLGLFLYDHLGGRKLLPATRTLNMKTDSAALPLKPLFTKAFEYSDCRVDDARFVVLNAKDAQDKGAVILTRTKVIKAARDQAGWTITLQDQNTDEQSIIKSRLLINAAGPWADKVIAGVEGEKDAHNVRLVQGSHIVIRKKFDDPRAYFFQNNDGRIIFAIPYEQDFTMIGTTDQDYHGDPAQVAITPDETDYLCKSASEYFREPINSSDIVWSFSGVRPLYDDGATQAQEATRDYVLKEDTANGLAPLINVFGGKLTTSRRLAEHMLEKVELLLGKKAPSWTAHAALPGGEFAIADYDLELKRLQVKYPFLASAHAQRLFRLYGLKAYDLLGESASFSDLGQLFGADLYAKEVDYLTAHEWAQTAEDILWRRTKLGLHFKPDEVLSLEKYLSRKIM